MNLNLYRYKIVQGLKKSLKILKSILKGFIFVVLSLFTIGNFASYKYGKHKRNKMKSIATSPTTMEINA